MTDLYGIQKTKLSFTIAISFITVNYFFSLRKTRGKNL